MKGLEIILHVGFFNTGESEDRSHTLLLILFKRQRLAWIFIASLEKRKPHQKISLGNSAQPLTFNFVHQFYKFCRRQCRQKLLPVQDQPQRPRVNNWGGRMMQFLAQFYHFGVKFAVNSAV